MARTELTGKQIKDSSVDLTVDVTGVLPVANGGTGSDTLTVNNLLVGNGTGALQTIAPGATGAMLTSTGTTWSSQNTRGAANGLASLDANTTVPTSQMPFMAGEVVFSAPGSTWDASTNTPTLSDGQFDTSYKGVVFRVTSSGTVNFGGGNIEFANGDYVVYTGTKWIKPSALDTTILQMRTDIFGKETVNALIAKKDANGNLSADNFIPGFATTSVTTDVILTADSAGVQEFTGGSAQTVILPTTGITAGHTITIIKTGTNQITVKASDNTITAFVPASTAAVFTALTATPTAAGHWRYSLLVPNQVTSSSSGATIALRDNSSNLVADNFVPSLTTTATTAGTTTLTIDSNGVQEFTGTQTQTVKLPSTSVTAGYTITIINNSTTAISIQTSASSGIANLSSQHAATFTALSASPTVANAWKYNTFSQYATSTSPTANLIALRDAAGAIQASSFIGNVTQLTTASGVTSLISGSASVELFSGTQQQTVRLPGTVTSTGHAFTIINDSTSSIVVQSSGPATIMTLMPNTQATFTALNATPTLASHWSYNRISSRFNGISNLSSGSTITESHYGKTLTLNSASDATITIPLNSTASFPVGTEIELVNINTGQWTIAAASGATVNSFNGLKTAGQWACVTLRKIASDGWVATGNLTA